MTSKEVDEILRKHGARIESEIQTDSIGNNGISYSSEYVRFKEEMAHNLTRYERWCKSLGSLIKLKVSQKDENSIKKYLEVAHLEVEPWQALTLSVMTFLGVFLTGVLISVAISLIYGVENFPILFLILMMLLSVFLFYFVKGYPERLANTWRLKASSQMVPCILYVVVYMRHTPNLEKAIAFASEHLDYPLALDFKKVFYDVQLGKFSTIKESLDSYLEVWRGYNSDFIESFHLIESSLFEPNDARRIITLEKALQVVLDGVYDKMLKFTHEVKAPLTNIYMLGIVLPTLGLALLPLASAMLRGALKYIHVFVLFNLIVPLLVYYLTDKVMLYRPGGHGETRLLESNPYYSEYKSITPYFTAFLVSIPFLIIGLLPLIFQYTPVPELLGIQKDFSFSEFGLSVLGNDNFFNFIGTNGPFGVGAAILSLFIPFSIALFFYLSYNMKTKNLIKERNNTDELEREFNSSLFQLGNRLGNGVPPELVFGKVAESTKGLKTEDFFRRVDYNVKGNGMSVERAIFDVRQGAIIYFPSQLIATSMKIMIESSKKGLKIAATSLMSISEYVKNIEKITDRLKDILAEVASDMKSNMTFLAPLLSGVVVGLAVMIAVILNKLQLPDIAGEIPITGTGLEGMLDIFSLSSMIPAYFLQISIGIYIIQIIFILTGTLVTIDAGEDKLQKTYQTGKNVFRGIMLYLIVAFVSISALYILSSIVLGGALGG
ncbi:MAG: hypothetical protein AABX30_03565 [Nanoarchaeota archaeon]